MKSSAKPEPKARAAADSEDSLESSDSPNGSADDSSEVRPNGADGQERAGEFLLQSSEPPADDATQSSKAKRKSKASLKGSEPNNVRKLRQEAMMSKAELARRAGVSPLTIDRVEAGSPCRMDTKRKILEALGLSPSARAEVWPDIDGG
jgi:DNA-binding XRE family transcriptional regulator